jgi:hypothetical protein
MDAKKYLCRFGDSVWLDFHISRRTCKKRGFATKYENMYNLGTDGGVQAIRYFVRILKAYLDAHKPQWLAICPAEDKNEKRTNFYQDILNRMGYFYVGRDRDENGEELTWIDLYAIR